MRKTIIAYLRSHEDAFAVFVGDAAEWRGYLSRMAVDRSWGDELTLQASAEAWDVVVHVVTSSDEHYYLMYGTPAPSPRALFTPRAARRKRTAQRHCFLTYTAPVHYNVLSAEPVPPGGDVLL